MPRSGSLLARPAASLPAVALVFAFALAGCDSRGGEPRPRAAAPAVARAPDSAAPLPDAGDAAANVRLALAEDGLRLVDGRSGATRTLPFGATRAQLLAALAAVSGRPRDTAVNPDCGAGAQESVMWGGGLVTWVQGDRFVGWSVNASADTTAADTTRRLTTMAGVGLGSTRRELEAAYSTQVRETSLGTEFETAGLYGVLDSDGAAARITNLWTGATCVFR